MGIITVQPQGGYNNQKNFPLKNWKAECPRCQHIEVQEGDGNSCPNCSGELQMTYAYIFGGKWESEEAKDSWRVLSCKKDCGWKTNEVKCSKCDATIRGKYFKGTEQAVKTNCFVATSAFNQQAHPTVITLQHWRDSFLCKSAGGRTFIAWYWRNGPRLANSLDKMPVFKSAVRFFLSAIATLITAFEPKNPR